MRLSRQPISGCDQHSHPIFGANGDGTFSLAARQTVLDQLAQDVPSAIKETTDIVNHQILSGALKSTENPAVYDPEMMGEATPYAAERIVSRSGYSRLETHWWGISLKIDSYWSDKLIAAAGSVSGVLWVLDALAAAGTITLPAALPASVLAATFAAAAGILALCKGSNGMVINHLWNPSTPSMVLGAMKI